MSVVYKDIENSPQRGLSSTLMKLSNMVHDILRGTSESNQLQRSALSAFLVRVFSAGLAYLSQVLIARMLGTFEYGVFAYVWVWVIMIGHGSTMGFAHSVIRFIPKYAEEKAPGEIRGFLLAGQVIALISSILLAGMGAVGVYLFKDYLESCYVMPIFLAAVCVPLFALQDVQEGIARSFGWVNLGLIPTYLVRPALVIVFLIVALLLKAPVNASTAMLASIAAIFVSGLAQMAVIYRRTSKILDKNAPRQYRLRYWIMVSFPLVLFEIFYNLQAYADMLVLNLYVPPDQLAIYFAAAKTVGLVAFVHFAVGAAVGQKFSAYDTAGKRERLREFVRETTHWTFWPAVGAASGILALGHYLLWMFGPEFTAGYPVMFVLAAGIMFRAASGQSEYLLNMLGHQNQVAVLLFATLLANVALNFMLIPSYGLMGAASATAVTLALQSIALAVMARRLTGLDTFLWIPKRFADTGSETKKESA